jgi:hypothetical protein
LTSRRRALALGLGAFVAALARLAAAQSDTPAALAALRLATLAERMAKLQAQAALGILPERSRRGIAEATREFEAQLKRARARNVPPDARDNLLLLAILWDEHRAWVARAPSRENARRLVERTEEVVHVAEKAARLAGPSGGPAVRAQRAAMLSQRVPRLYLLRRGPSDDAPRQAAEQELRQEVATLAAGAGNTPEALAELQLVENQLQFLERATAEREGGPRRLEFIAKAGDHLMESLARLARLYEGSGA